MMIHNDVWNSHRTLSWLGEILTDGPKELINPRMTPDSLKDIPNFLLLIFLKLLVYKITHRVVKVTQSQSFRS